MIVPVVPGECFVAKDRETAYIKPSVDSNLLEDQLIRDWLSEAKEVEEWTKLMDTVFEKVKRTDITQGQDVKVSPRGLESQADLKAKVIGFKTPKSKRLLAEEDEEVHTPIVPEKTTTEEDENFKDESLDEKVKSLLKLLDDKIGELWEVLEKFADWKTSKSRFTSKLGVHTEAIFDLLKKKLGKKMNEYPADLRAVDLWGACEILAHQVNDMPDEVKAIVKENLKLLNDNIATVKDDLSFERHDQEKASDELKTSLGSLPFRLSCMEKFTMEATKVLKALIDASISRIEDVANEQALGALQRTDNIRGGNSVADEITTEERMVQTNEQQ